MNWKMTDKDFDNLEWLYKHRLFVNKLIEMETTMKPSTLNISMTNEIIAVVKFNDREALVLKEEPKLIYTKYGTDTIIGTDGVFYNFYGYEEPKGSWAAFAGRKFDLELDNGKVEKCYGQWWDSITKKAIEVLGINETDNKVIYATACSVENLKKCYVFHGYKGLSKKIEEFRNTYTGKVYDYMEYEKLLRQKP